MTLMELAAAVSSTALPIGGTALGWLFQLKARVDIHQVQIAAQAEDLKYIRTRVDAIAAKVGVSLVLLALLAAPASAQDWSPVVAKTAPGVLRMESTDGESGGGICSVVVIDKARGFAVTAAHCIPLDPGTRSMAVAKRDVTVERVNRVLDLAVIKIDRLAKLKDVVNVPVRATDAPVGTPVAILGYAMGSEQLKSQFGHISETETDFVREGVLSDAQIFPGDSGGAFVDANGELLAVSSAVLGRFLFPNAYAVGSNGEALRLYVADYLPRPVQVAKK